ncbi:MAG: preprotein translocase subunit YajC [Kiritimatiellae bacterium]|nr:preprotein translocase subunit YajC [Kiritimatiellia bacterium]
MGGLGGMMLPMLVIFGIMYFMMIRPQQRKEKERQAMIKAVKTGDRVLFSGGILGTVTNVKDASVIIRISDGVKVEVVRGGIQKVLEKGEKLSGEEASEQ